MSRKGGLDTRQRKLARMLRGSGVKPNDYLSAKAVFFAFVVVGIIVILAAFIDLL